MSQQIHKISIFEKEIHNNMTCSQVLKIFSKIEDARVWKTNHGRGINTIILRRDPTKSSITYRVSFHASKMSSVTRTVEDELFNGWL